MNNQSTQSSILKLDPKWPIGVFDSGLGGLTVLKDLQKALPEEDFVYVADNKYCPYGNRSADDIRQRSNTILNFFSSYPMKAVVVACNTATAAAVKNLRENFNIPIIGVEPGVKPACEITQSGQIGVLATAGTLKSEKYENLRNLHGKDVEVFEQACEGLVQAIENEYPDFSETKDLLKLYLDPFKSQRVDTIVLGCTHYPLIEELIHKLMHSVVTINTGAAIARQLESQLKKFDLKNSGNFSPTINVLASKADKVFSEKVDRLMHENYKNSKTQFNIIQLPEHYC